MSAGRHRPKLETFLPPVFKLAHRHGARHTSIEIVLLAFPHVVDDRTDMIPAVHALFLGKMREHLNGEAAIEAVRDLPTPRATHDLGRHPPRGPRLSHNV